MNKKMAKKNSKPLIEIFFDFVSRPKKIIWVSTGGRIEFAELNHSDWISVEFQRRNHCSHRKWRRNQEPPGDQERQAVGRGELHLQTFYLTVCLSQTVRHWRWDQPEISHSDIFWAGDLPAAMHTSAQPGLATNIRLATLAILALATDSFSQINVWLSVVHLSYVGKINIKYNL